jgi:hypothetical protein
MRNKAASEIIVSRTYAQKCASTVLTDRTSKRFLKLSPGRSSGSATCRDRYANLPLRDLIGAIEEAFSVSMQAISLFPLSVSPAAIRAIQSSIQ